MALTVVNRPSKVIDGSTSTWNATSLPIQYKLNSDLFPVNSVDANPVVVTFTNNNTFLEVEVGASLTNVLVGETIQLSGCDVDSYNGIFKVKEVISTTEFVLFAPYSADLTVAYLQKYYNNYFAEVRVYSGLPTWHQSYLDKPIADVGTLKVIPNTDNDIVASFSGLIKSDINFTKQLNEGIDLDSFTGFYVEWREGYDKNIDDNIETFYTSWETDDVFGNGVDQITNGDFNTDLSGWTQIDATITSEPFVWNAGQYAESNLITYRKSKIIYQEVNLVENVAYDLAVDITRSNSIDSRFVIYGTNDLVSFYTLYLNDGNGNVSVSETIVPNNSFTYIGYHFYKPTTDNTTVTIDNVTLTPNGQYLFWGSNSALQFQNARGGNMYDYVAGRSDSKFMTNFDTPTYFNGSYFDLSIILNSNTDNDFDISSVAEMWLNGDDLPSGGALIDSWIDRTGNHTVTSTGTQRPTSIDLGVNGKRGVDFTGGSTERLIVSLMDIPQPCVLYTVFNNSDISSRGLILDNFNASFYTGGNLASLYAGSGTFSATSLNNIDHVSKVVLNGSNSEIWIDNVLVATGDAGSAGFESAFYHIGYSSATGTLTGIVNEIIILDANIDKCYFWQTESYLANKYNTYTNSGLGYYASEYNTSGELLNTINGDITDDGVGLYRLELPAIDSNTNYIKYKLVNPVNCSLSEEKTINVSNECYNQEIYLTWLNEFGGWDYWKFTAEKDYNLNIESKETIKRNVFADWDNDFINGDTENDVISTTANRSISVFSQYLNEDEVNAISAIKYSPKVQVIDGSKKTTVIVDSNTVTLFNDGEDENLHTFRFDIQFPDIQIQSQ